jgi:DNA-binding MarR family transcriptional regulator
MKFKAFRERSLIMGVVLAAQSLQSWTRRNFQDESGLSFLGCLILIALYFEEEKGGIGPSRLAHTLGFSRSRVSQELSALSRSGYIRRSICAASARAVNVTLSTAGERKATELVRAFSRLQSAVDVAVGERQAEVINRRLLSLHERLASN